MNFESKNQKEIVANPVSLGLPLDREILFSDHKKVYKKKLEKQRTKLLKKVAPIKRFLQDDEKILLISTGCSPASILEQMLTGWIFVYLKRSLFIFTNKRILHIPTHRDFSFRNSIAQILYTDCKSIEMKGSRLVVEYQNGTKEKFLYIPRKEGKKLKSLLPTLSLEGYPGQKGKRVHLCPRCTHELEENKYSCPNCQLRFKEMDKGRKLSLLYPGGGYFYTRHPFLGISDAIVETIFLLLVLVSLISFVKGVKGSGTQLIIFTAFLAIEKAVTVFHANHFIKEYIPMDKEITPIT